MPRLTVLMLVLIVSACSSLPTRELNPIEAPVKGSVIGYPSVVSALEDLKRNPDAKVRVEDGWTIINIQTSERHELWSFTPVTHPAHPAVVKRSIIEDNEKISIVTNALCQANKIECDALISQFEELNQRITERMKK